MHRIANLVVTTLNSEDPGESAEDFQRSNPDQDAAFCAAMDRAIQRGKERSRRGVQTKPIDGVLRVIRGETIVLGSSPANFV